MKIEQPYLLFLGDAADQLAAKTAQGIADWRLEQCVGQLRFSDCKADLGLTEMSLEEGLEAGAKTLVIGVANRGGIISDAWTEVLERALELGLDLAAGLHNKLADVPELAEAASKYGRKLSDVRHSSEKFSVGDGKKRPGKRMLKARKATSTAQSRASSPIRIQGSSRQRPRSRTLSHDTRATRAIAKWKVEYQPK